MEKIREAIERARAYGARTYTTSLSPKFSEPRVSPRRLDLEPGESTRSGRIADVAINPNFLLSKRIVSFNGADQRSRPYDILRTQVLQSMSVAGWKTLGVTSPTPRCGKTVTAINLAFSIGRQQDQSVVLIDMDLQRPQVGNCLGVTADDGGLLGMLEERTDLRNITIPVRAGTQEILVVPTASTRISSELMASNAMRNLLVELRKSDNITILDLPPILSSDDVLSVLPQIDCVMLVTAVGLSQPRDVEACMTHLQSSQLVRVVLNKAPDTHAHYYY
jgi:protein-tyrosine kinase